MARLIRFDRAQDVEFLAFQARADFEVHGVERISGRARQPSVSHARSTRPLDLVFLAIPEVDVPLGPNCDAPLIAILELAAGANAMAQPSFLSVPRISKSRP